MLNLHSTLKYDIVEIDERYRELIEILGSEDEKCSGGAISL